MDMASTNTLFVLAPATPSDDLAGRLADEMIRRWNDGERPRAEEFLQQHEELQQQPDAAIRLIYEEICLRHQSGEMVAPEEMTGRFPHWQDRLHALLENVSYRTLPTVRQPSSHDVETVEKPGPTGPLADYVVLAELGRGSQGRVYLASQPNLANRLVVLKMTERAGREHHTLARLQHTHIMPLYAVHDEPKRNRRTLCMPYFGGTSFSEVLNELSSTPINQRTGRHILDVIDHAADDIPQDVAAHATGMHAAGPSRPLLERASYVEAICWIGACLADALQYAHERGLVHLDLKPDNVLLAADGQPLLLDFHIAQNPIRPDQPIPEVLGGTPAYLSPEQDAAITAIEMGRPIPIALDGRSDLYSLGLLLYEALAGCLPVRNTNPASSLRACNPHVSPGLSDIIAKCLRRDPEHRYPTAAALATDLRHHLQDRPLAGVRNRSLVERWRKWRRRRPHALSLTSMSFAVLAAAVSLGLFAYHQVDEQRRHAEAALQEGKQHLRNRSYAQAADTLARGLTLAEGVPTSGDLTSRFNEQLQIARRGLAAEQLHTLVDQMRYAAASSFPRDEARSLAHRWREIWNKRAWLTERRAGKLDASTEQRLDADLLDLGILWADLCVRLADPDAIAAAHREALQVLAETEALFGASHILYRQRQFSAQALGETKVAEMAHRSAAEQPPQTAWEHYALGRSLLQSGDLVQAGAALDRAVELQPQAFWPHFYQGVCHYRRNRFEDAVSAFAVSIALAPDSAESYHNRALAQAALTRHDRALADYDRALHLNPQLGPALLNRGLLHFKHKHYTAALADLDHALAYGCDTALVHYNRALIQLEQHDWPAAIASLQLALQANPSHKAARTLLGQLQR